MPSTEASRANQKKASAAQIGNIPANKGKEYLLRKDFGEVMIGKLIARFGGIDEIVKQFPKGVAQDAVLKAAHEYIKKSAGTAEPPRIEITNNVFEKMTKEEIAELLKITRDDV
jgi:hypothetical protein